MVRTSTRSVDHTQTEGDQKPVKMTEDEPTFKKSLSAGGGITCDLLHFIHGCCSRYIVKKRGWFYKCKNRQNFKACQYLKEYLMIFKTLKLQMRKML
jgi:hypothetical protein